MLIQYGLRSWDRTPSLSNDFCPKKNFMETQMIDPYLFSPYRYLTQTGDRVAEWLRRWTANPIRSPRVVANPISVECLFTGTKSFMETKLIDPYLFSPYINQTHTGWPSC